jgi:hypothetical protein
MQETRYIADFMRIPSGRMRIPTYEALSTIIYSPKKPPFIKGCGLILVLTNKAICSAKTIRVRRRFSVEITSNMME